MARQPTLKTIYRAIQGLQLPEGTQVDLFPWQKAFIRDVLRNETRIASMSIARSNGKSLVAAVLGWLYLDGPLKKPGMEIVIASSSFTTGLVLFELVKGWVPEDRYRILDSKNAAVIMDEETRSRLQVVGTNAKTVHGRPISLGLFDEPAQVVNREGVALFNALQTGLGKRANSKLAVLGTRSSDPEHWSNRLLKEHADVKLDYSYSGDEPFLQRNYAKANPSIWYLPVLKNDLRRAAALAKKDAIMARSFLNYHCNQGTPEHEDLEGLLDPDVYQDLEGEVDPDSSYVLGLDLSGGWAMTAAAAVDLYPDRDGKHHVDAFAAWPGDPGVAEREKQDSVAAGTYQAMVDAGDLVMQEGSRVVDVGAVMDEAVARWGQPSVIVGDRYRQRELEGHAIRYGMTIANGGLQLRGQGYRDGSEDVREFQRMAMDRRLVVPRSDLLRRAFAAARVISDMAGNQKIAKEGERGRTGRDDTAVAVVVAAAEVSRQLEEPQEEAQLELIGTFR